MPTNGFGSDFFDSVLGTATDNLGSWMQALPAFPDLNVSLPSYADMNVSLPAFQDTPNPVLSGGLFDSTAPFLDAQQAAINAARTQGPMTVGALANKYGVASQQQGQGAPARGGGQQAGVTQSSSASIPQGELVDYARAVAKQYGVDPDIFVRQINQESGFKVKAQSGVGARGIAQFMPSTAAQYGVNVNDPYSSLDGAARHMKDMLARYHGDYRYALAAYNAGAGNVDKYGEGVFAPDFARGQTRDYVHAILGR